MILGHFLGAMQPEKFRHTHGYFEVAAAVGLMAAVGYTVRLWPYRTDRRLKVPLRINLCFIALVALVIALAGARAGARALFAAASVHFCSAPMRSGPSAGTTNAQQGTNILQEIDPFGDSPGTGGTPYQIAPVKIKSLFFECGSRTDEINFDWIIPFESTTAEQVVPPDGP